MLLLTLLTLQDNVVYTAPLLQGNGPAPVHRDGLKAAAAHLPSTFTPTPLLFLLFECVANYS
jgi:hypothetical protein